MSLAESLVPGTRNSVKHVELKQASPSPDHLDVGCVTGIAPPSVTYPGTSGKSLLMMLVSEEMKKQRLVNSNSRPVLSGAGPDVLAGFQGAEYPLCPIIQYMVSAFQIMANGKRCLTF